MPPKKKKNAQNQPKKTAPAKVEKKIMTRQSAIKKAQAATQNKKFLQKALTSALKTNKVPDYSQTGLTFVSVERQLSMKSESNLSELRVDPLDLSLSQAEKDELSAEINFADETVEDLELPQRVVPSRRATRKRVISPVTTASPSSRSSSGSSSSSSSGSSSRSSSRSPSPLFLTPPTLRPPTRAPIAPPQKAHCSYRYSALQRSVPQSASPHPTASPRTIPSPEAHCSYRYSTLGRSLPPTTPPRASPPPTVLPPVTPPRVSPPPTVLPPAIPPRTSPPSTVLPPATPAQEAQAIPPRASPPPTVLPPAIPPRASPPPTVLPPAIPPRTSPPSTILPPATPAQEAHCSYRYTALERPVLPTTPPRASPPPTAMPTTAPLPVSPPPITLPPDSPPQEEHLSDTVLERSLPPATPPSIVLPPTDPTEKLRTTPVKYDKLLLKYSKQSTTLKRSRKKTKALKDEVAQLKDLVVRTVADAQKAQDDPDGIKTFTTDPEIEITLEEIEKINSISKNVGCFAQNLAMYFYGAARLRERSVTGRKCNRLKDRPARPPISPKIMKFIYSKANERVTLKYGSSNREQIEILAHKSVVNKAIAEKIANLNKAAIVKQRSNNSKTS